jgi:hypothetical protein
MSVEEWTGKLLTENQRGRVEQVHAVMVALAPGWEAVWAPADDLGEEDVVTVRRGIEVVGQWLAGRAPSRDELESISESCEDVALRVGEEAQALDSEEQAGTAHLVTALLACTLNDISGTEGARSLEEVVAAIPDLVGVFPALEGQLGRVIMPSSL